MSDQTITCPQCGNNIPLSEALTTQLTSAIQKDLQESFAKEKELFIKKQKLELWEKAQVEAKKHLDRTIKEKDEELELQKKKLEEFQKYEIELRRQKRELEEGQRKLELEIERRLDNEKKKLDETLRKELEENMRLKLLEKDKQMEQIKKQLDEANRRATQGSQQIQGDALEGDIKALIQKNFPSDTIKDVPTGMSGADLIQTIHTPQGSAGILLWEIKNTKSFSQEWTTKLREDQSRAHADVCILVTKALPEGITSFGEYKGVFVVDFEYIIPLAFILRNKVIELSKLKTSLEGSSEKAHILYQYLLSPDFKNKIELIFSTFTKMKTDLEREKSALNAIWSRREKEINRALDSTSRLYGELQGVTGEALPKVERLELQEKTDVSENDDGSTLF